MALVLSYKAARMLYDLALAQKKDPSEVMAELIRRAAEEQKQGRERPGVRATAKEPQEASK